MSISQQAVAVRRSQSREIRKPDFIVRAPDPQRRGRWVTLGAAWQREDGGLNIKLQTVPVGIWDGALVCLPPLPNGDDPEPNPEE